jgi:hypothetical protein
VIDDALGVGLGIANLDGGLDCGMGGAHGLHRLDDADESALQGGWLGIRAARNRRGGDRKFLGR